MLYLRFPIDVKQILHDILRLEVVLKPQIRPTSKTQTDEKAQHTRSYVSILKRFATQLLGLRWDFKTTSRYRLTYNVLSAHIKVLQESEAPKYIRIKPFMG
jgi:hypothetical protein